MARCIKHTAQSPHEVKPSAESQWMCMCGLSKNLPFCDGSHEHTLDEEVGKTYHYNADDTRNECSGSCDCCK